MKITYAYYNFQKIVKSTSLFRFVSALPVLASVFLFRVVSPRPINAQISTNTVRVEFQCVANLELYNGQNGILSDSRGAVTVANLNDTDGDGLTDNVDRNVVKTPKGRDEVDLMKLIIKKTQSVSNEVDFLLVVKGNVKLWKFPTKKDSLPLTNNQVSVKNLLISGTATLYVEAFSPSAVPKDIEIQIIQKSQNNSTVCDVENSV